MIKEQKKKPVALSDFSMYGFLKILLYDVELLTP